MKKIFNENIINTKMKQRIMRLSKIYFFFILVMLIISCIYAYLIHKDIIKVSPKSFNNTTFIIGIICFFILGLICGISAKKNGFLDAFITSLIIIMISLILNLFLKEKYTSQTFIKSAVYVLSSSLGGVIGINISTKKQSN